MDPVTVTYELSLPEFMAACQAHWAAHGQSARSNIITGVIGMAVGGVVLLFVRWLGMVLLGLGGLLLFITWLRLYLWRRAYSENRKYPRPITATFGSDSIHVETADGISDLKWTLFSQYLDTPDFVLLYLTKRSFSIIPKSAFASDGALSAFLVIVAEKLDRVK